LKINTRRSMFWCRNSSRLTKNFPHLILITPTLLKRSFKMSSQ